MKTPTSLLAVALAGVTATASAAGTIATTLEYLGVGAQGACYIRNVGPRPASIDVEVDDSTDRLTPAFDGCNGAPLGSGATCVVLFQRSRTASIGCSATTRSGSAKNLRGTLEIRDTNGGLHTTGAVDLR